MTISPHTRKHILSAAFSALVSFMLLVLLKPFGINELNVGTTVYCLGMSAIIMVVVFIFDSLHDLLQEKRTGKTPVARYVIYILLLALLIGVSIAVFHSIVMSEHLSFKSVLSDILSSLIMTGIVFIIVSLTEKNIMLKGELEEEKKLNTLIQKRLQSASNPTASELEETVHITGTTRKQVDFMVHDFLYASSEGNYIDISYLDAGNRRKEDVRMTMKDLEEKLATYPNIVRCHRAFMVNIDMIESAQGNAQGYILSLKGTSETVPVSRSYVDIIKKKISQDLA